MPKKVKKLKSPTAKSPGRRKKQEGFVPQLWINQTTYEFGKKCTYCDSQKATWHCPSCPEFLCDKCDKNIHSHKKHANHVRAKICKWSLITGSNAIKGFFWYLKCREILRAYARQRYLRFYSADIKGYYYFEKRDKRVQWHKPYCCKNIELFPPLDTEAAIKRIVTFYRMVHAWDIMNNLTHECFRRVYDEELKKCYYRYVGHSPLQKKTMWKRPTFLYKNEDIKLEFTPCICKAKISSFL